MNKCGMTKEQEQFFRGCGLKIPTKKPEPGDLISAVFALDDERVAIRRFKSWSEVYEAVVLPKDVKIVSIGIVEFRTLQAAAKLLKGQWRSPNVRQQTW